MRASLILSLFLLSSPVFAGNQCVDLFSYKVLQTYGIWGQPRGRLVMTLRSNTPHYWRWAKENMPIYVNEKEAKFLLAEGTISGDPHYNNFAIQMNREKNTFGLVDFDDGGRGPYFIDIVRFATVVRATKEELSTQDIFEAYRAGLIGEEMKIPKLIREELEMKPNEIDKRLDAYVEKRLKKDGKRIDHKELDTRSTDDWTPEEFKLYKQAEPIFKAALGDRKILDVGIYVKENGGSRGMTRFRILTTLKGNKELFEFKQNVSPGVAQYEKQESEASRLEDLKEVFTDPVTYSEHGAVVVGDYTFYMHPMRPKRTQVDDRADKKQDIKDFNKYNLYIAYFMGEMHGKQKSAQPYIQFFADNFPQVVGLADKMINDYHDLAKKLHDLDGDSIVN